MRGANSPYFNLPGVSTAQVEGLIFGVVMGTREAIMRSAIADFTPFDKRGTGYGPAHLIGAALMGWLYDRNQIGTIMAFTCVVGALVLTAAGAAIFAFWFSKKRKG